MPSGGGGERLARAPALVPERAPRDPRDGARVRRADGLPHGAPHRPRDRERLHALPAAADRQPPRQRGRLVRRDDRGVGRRSRRSCRSWWRPTRSSASCCRSTPRPGVCRPASACSPRSTTPRRSPSAPASHVGDRLGVSIGTTLVPTTLVRVDARGPAPLPADAAGADPGAPRADGRRRPRGQGARVRAGAARSTRATPSATTAARTPSRALDAGRRTRPSPAPAASLFLPWLTGIWAPAGDGKRARRVPQPEPRDDARASRARGARGGRLPAALDAAAHRGAHRAPSRRAGLRRGRRALGRLGADPRRRLRPSRAAARRAARSPTVAAPRCSRSTASARSISTRPASSWWSAGATSRAREHRALYDDLAGRFVLAHERLGPVFGGPDRGGHAMTDTIPGTRASASTRRVSAPTPCARARRRSRAREDGVWADGRCSGTIYCGDRAIYDLIAEAFGHFSYVNVLQRDMCPSQTRFESEIIAMTLDMLHGDAARARGLDALRRDRLGRLREHHLGDLHPPRVGPRREGHQGARDDPAGDGARGLRQGRALLRRRRSIARARRSGDDARRRRLRAQPHQSRTRCCWSARPATTPTARSTRSRSSRSSPLEHDIGLHVDGCLGGFILPWGEQLGYDIPRLRLPPARRHHDLGRHAQVRLRAEGHLGAAVPRQGAAAPPVLRAPRLEGRHVRLARHRRQPLGRADRRDLGRDGRRSAARATSTRRARDLRDRLRDAGRGAASTRRCA